MRIKLFQEIPSSHNRFRRSFGLLSAVVLLFFAACSSSEEGDTPYLNVFPTSMLFDAEAMESNVIEIEANGLWIATPATADLKIDKTTGFGDDQIRVLAAPKGKSRMTIVMGATEQRVEITRLGGDDPNPDPDPDPDPDPTPGEALFGKSWAEMPAELVKTGDYYYTYHMRADASAVRNFTVCYSKELMCPVWIAAPMHSSYKGSSGRNDAYKSDPTLEFTQPGRWDGYTRGHMLGSSDRTISKPTNKQVFYHSNIAPQLQNGFNQGDGVWNNLEEHLVDKQWCADTLYQVIGCYWENENKKVDRTVIPTHYYKILLRTKSGNTRKSVADCSASELKCAVFMVEHRNQKGQEPNASMMMSVSDLEKKTGFTFFPNVPNAPKSTYSASDWGL